MDNGESAGLDALASDLRALEEMSLHQLRQFWEARWGMSPRLRSPPLLRFMIAWRLQSAAAGGLDTDTKARLRRKGTPRAAPPPVGTQLTREYKGVLHRAEVEAQGVRYDGRLYRSVSDVAQAITGTRWNGPRFFGLRKSTTDVR